MNKHTMQVMKDNNFGHLPCEFSQIAWYFLVHSGEIVGSLSNNNNYGKGNTTRHKLLVKKEK